MRCIYISYNIYVEQGQDQWEPQAQTILSSNHSIFSRKCSTKVLTHTYQIIFNDHILEKIEKIQACSCVRWRMFWREGNAIKISPPLNRLSQFSTAYHLCPTKLFWTQPYVAPLHQLAALAALHSGPPQVIQPWGLYGRGFGIQKTLVAWFLPGKFSSFSWRLPTKTNQIDWIILRHHRHHFGKQHIAIVPPCPWATPLVVQQVQVQPAQKTVMDCKGKCCYTWYGCSCYVYSANYKWTHFILYIAMRFSVHKLKDESLAT